MGYVIDGEHRITYPGASLSVHGDVGLQTSETFPREILNQTMYDSNQPNDTTENKPKNAQQQST